MGESKEKEIVTTTDLISALDNKIASSIGKKQERLMEIRKKLQTETAIGSAKEAIEELRGALTDEEYKALDKMISRNFRDVIKEAIKKYEGLTISSVKELLKLFEDKEVITEENRYFLLGSIVSGLNKKGISFNCIKDSEEKGYLTLTSPQYKEGDNFATKAETKEFENLFNNALVKGIITKKDFQRAMLYRTWESLDSCLETSFATEDNFPNTSSYVLYLMRKYDLSKIIVDKTGQREFLEKQECDKSYFIDVDYKRKIGFNKVLEVIDGKVTSQVDREFLRTYFSDIHYNKGENIDDGNIGKYKKDSDNVEKEIQKELGELDEDTKTALGLKDGNALDDFTRDLKRDPVAGVTKLLFSPTIIGAGIFGFICLLFGKKWGMIGAIAGAIIFGSRDSWAKELISDAFSGSNEDSGGSSSKGSGEKGKGDKKKGKPGADDETVIPVVESDSRLPEEDPAKKTTLVTSLSFDEKNRLKKVKDKINTDENTPGSEEVPGRIEEQKEEKSNEEIENILIGKYGNFINTVDELNQHKNFWGGKGGKERQDDSVVLAGAYNELYYYLIMLEVKSSKPLVFDKNISDKDKKSLIFAQKRQKELVMRIKLNLVKFYSNKLEKEDLEDVDGLKIVKKDIDINNKHDKDYLKSTLLALGMLPDEKNGVKKPKMPGQYELSRRLRGQIGLRRYVEREVEKGDRSIDEIFLDSGINEIIVDAKKGLGEEYEENLENYLKNLNTAGFSPEQKEALDLLKDIKGIGWHITDEKADNWTSLGWGVGGMLLGTSTILIPGVDGVSGFLIVGGASGIGMTVGKMFGDGDDYFDSMQDFKRGGKEFGLNMGTSLAFMGAGKAASLFLKGGTLLGSTSVFRTGGWGITRGLGYVGSEIAGGVGVGASSEMVRSKIEGFDLDFGDAAINNFWWALLPFFVRGVGFSVSRIRLAKRVNNMVEGAETLKDMGSNPLVIKRILGKANRMAKEERSFDSTLKPFEKKINEVRNLSEGESLSVGKTNTVELRNGDYIFKDKRFEDFVKSKKGKSGVEYTYNGEKLKLDIDSAGKVTKIEGLNGDTYILQTNGNYLPKSLNDILKDNANYGKTVDYTHNGEVLKLDIDSSGKITKIENVNGDVCTINSSGEQIFQAGGFKNFIEANKGKSGVKYTYNGEKLKLDIDVSGKITKLVNEDGGSFQLKDGTLIDDAGFQKVSSDINNNLSINLDNSPLFGTNIIKKEILDEVIKGKIIKEHLQGEILKKLKKQGDSIDVGGVKIQKIKKGYKVKGGDKDYTTLDHLFENELKGENFIKYGNSVLDDVFRAKISDINFKLENRKYYYDTREKVFKFEESEGVWKRVNNQTKFVEDNFEFLFKKINGFSFSEGFKSFVESVKAKNMTLGDIWKKMGKAGEFKDNRLYNMTIANFLAMPRVVNQVINLEFNTFKAYYKDVPKILFFGDKNMGLGSGLERTGCAVGLAGVSQLFDGDNGNDMISDTFTYIYGGVLWGLAKQVLEAKDIL